MKKITNKYLHGYSKEEQRRLIHQAQFLAPWVYEDIQFKKCKHILEVGCGVGAQTEILLKKFPHLKITAVDISEEQLRIARTRLKLYIKSKRVEFVQMNAENLHMLRGKFDGAFICWFLEHVPNPSAVLKSLKTKLKKNSTVYCSEVFNSTLYMDPYSPAMLKYWFEYNDHQYSINGHPFVGGELGHLLKDAGYKKIQTVLKPFHFDSRTPLLRKKFLQYWKNLMLSGAPELLQHQRVSRSLVEQMTAEINQVARRKDGVFFYAWIQACARS